MVFDFSPRHCFWVLVQLAVVEVCTSSGSAASPASRLIRPRLHVSSDVKLDSKKSIAGVESYSVLSPKVDPCNGRRPCRGFAGCVGRGDQWREGWATLKSLRATGNMDPVQIFHVDGELSTEAIQHLESVGNVKVHDLKEALGGRADLRKYRGYACSSMALLVSSFEHVMQISGDGILFSDPAPLWQDERLRRTGALFVRDRLALNTRGQALCTWIRNTALPWLTRTSPELHAALDEKFEERRQDVCLLGSKHLQCSNQVFIDRTRPEIQRVLAIFYRLQEAFFDFPKQYTRSRATSPGPFLGEKELYWISCELGGAACVDSFLETDVATLSAESDHTTHAGEKLLCGVTAHFLRGNTSQLLSANLAGDYPLPDLSLVALPSSSRARCGTPPGASASTNRLCCTAPGGVRRLSVDEKNILTHWNADNLTASVGLSRITVEERVMQSKNLATRRHDASRHGVLSFELKSTGQVAENIAPEIL